MSRPGSPPPCPPCPGWEVALPPRAPRVRQVRWQATQLSRTWDSLGTVACPQAKRALHDSLWHSLASEYDARHLSAYLRRQAVPLSPAFWALEAAWAADEQNHFDGLCWLYRRLYEVSAAEVTSRLAQRQPDFAPLSSLLSEEFRLCVVLAFDELASARAYARDIASYASLGAPAVALLRKLARDEMLHCRNAVDLLIRLHAPRLAEAEPIIAQVIAHDTSPQFSYRATFLLDQVIESSVSTNPAAITGREAVGQHVDFLTDCGRRLLRTLAREQTRINPC